MTTDAELGREHAIDYINHPKTFDTIGPRSYAYADAALDELEQQQRNHSELLEILLDGGNQGARHLNIDSVQGLREIVQNADDLGAAHVRFGTRLVEGKRQVLIVHDGAPVDLPHVLPMIYPFMSTKRGSASQKGRFGVGLKTLSRLGGGLAIHSAPFHFASRANLAVRVSPVEGIEDFYDPDRSETLFTLLLDDDVDDGFLAEWFENWSAPDLLFLDAVRAITLHDLNEGVILSSVAVSESKETRSFNLVMQSGMAPTVERTFVVHGRTWKRYVAEVTVPADKKRDGKATAATTPLGIAIPVDGVGAGRLHVALPTGISTGACFSIDGQFDPATSREALVNDPWNRWLADVATELSGAIAIHLAHAESPLAWLIVPITAASNSSVKWLNERLATGWSKAVETFAKDPFLLGGNEAGALNQLSYCDTDAEGLLEPADHLVVAGKAMVPNSMRDAGGHWRLVLDTIGKAKKISLPAILACCGDGRFDNKPADWFLSLAARCVALDLADLLIDCQWVPLAEGGRAWARERDAATELLSVEIARSSFAERHRLIRPVHPKLLEPSNEGVADWLASSANFVTDVSAKDILRAFARSRADEPINASRTDLCDIRDLFAEVPEREPTELGDMVGSALKLEAQRYELDNRGRRVTVPGWVSPGEVYLPASIEEQRDGWSRAAGDTPGLAWALAAYGDVLKISGRVSEGRSGRRRAAKRFLMLLGASTTPRLEQVQTLVSYRLPRLQADAPRQMGRAPSNLVNDHISPDLELVVADIVSGAEPRRRGGRRGGKQRQQLADRSLALYRCLAQGWSQLEPFSTVYARRESGRGNPVEVPATWVARLAEEPWLLTKTNEAAAPSGLAIATRVTSAMSDDPTRFAAGLGQADAEAPLARALDMAVDPPASQIVQSIDRYRSESSLADSGNILRLYRALAGHCPGGASVPAPDSRVDDMTVSSLRGRFGINSKRPGLIAGCATTLGDEGWYAPNAVFSGKDVFHRRRPFVLNDRELAPLWHALNITAPTVEDCIRELQQIAASPAGPERESVLIDIYRHLDRLLDKSSAVTRRALRSVPLLCGEKWATARPVFMCSYPGVALEKVLIWSPPCAVGTIHRLVSALEIEDLPIRSQPVSASVATDDDLQRRFDVALRILKANLAKEDEQSYKAMPWTQLFGLAVQTHGLGSLIVSAEPKGVVPVALAVRAHADVIGLSVHIDDESVLGRFEYGGQAIASFSQADRRREVALAWVSAWASSVDAATFDPISLAEEEAAEDVDALAAHFDRLKQSNGRRKMPTGKKGSGNGEVSRQVEVRKLKAATSEFVFGLELRDASEGAKKGPQVKKTDPLKKDAPTDNPGRRSEKQKPAPVGAHRQYDSRDLQQRGWDHLLMAIEDGKMTVSDFQALRGIGADGVIDWRTFVELKAVARETPAQVVFTEKEFLRAKERKGEFLLVVVSGLEEGFDTEITIYENPLLSLPWTVRGAVSVNGLGGGRALVLRERREEAFGDNVVSAKPGT